VGCFYVGDNMKFSKKIVIAVLISALAFTVAMTVAFYLFRSVPNTLIKYFFVFCGAEAGVLGLIKKSGV